MFRKFSVFILSVMLVFTSIVPAFAEEPAGPVAEPVEVSEAEPEVTTEAPGSVEVKEAPEAEEVPEETPEVKEVPEAPEVKESSEVKEGSPETPQQAVAEDSEKNIPEMEAPVIPEVTDIKLTSPRYRCFRVEWTAVNADKVKVFWSFTENGFTDANSETFPADRGFFEKSQIPAWTPVYIRLIPYKNGTAGDHKDTSANIYKGYEPAKVVLEKTTKESRRGLDALGIKVMTKNGKEIFEWNYTVTPPSKEVIGVNKGYITFSDTYKKYPKMSFTYTVIPKAPTDLCVFDIFTDGVKFDIDMTGFRKDFDYIEIVYANNKQFKNWKAVKISKSPSTSYKLGGLKPNTTYYARAKYVKKVGSKVYKSKYQQIAFRTPCNPPWPTKASKTTKNMLALMAKNNKSFTFTLPGPISGDDAPLYMYNIEVNYPQFMKFNYRFWYKDGKVYKIIFTYNKTKAAKANRLKAKMYGITKYAKTKKGTVEKIKYVNWRMKKMCRYCDKGADVTDAYGCLVNGRAVCNGYAYAFHALMLDLGIQEKFIASAKYNHIWNLVKVGNRWYHVDVTWNDCQNDNEYLLSKTHEM